MFKHQSLILTTDSYKTSHFNQRPEGTEGLFIYGSARRKTEGDDFTLFFGMQSIIETHLSNPVTMGDVEYAADLFSKHGVPFNQDYWKRVVNLHGGFAPVHIRAVEEGTIVPNGNALWTVESTDPELADIASYIEQLLLRVWYPSTVATRSYQAKLVIKQFLEETADNLDGLPFKLHDFGARGVSSGESAGIGGMAHLVNFYGTDTIEALLAARQFYAEDCAGYSIPAMEHSTVTIWGRGGEKQAFSNMLDKYAKPGSVLACVSDSYDIYNATNTIWGVDLKQKVIDSGATVVIRPDSGNPVFLIPQMLASLAGNFGFTVNSKGYKVLNHVRIIWGDGLNNAQDIRYILAVMKADGWSADNVAFGMGGGLLQKVNRDDLSFASKTSAALVNGEWIDVYKDPITDPGKASLRGRLSLFKNEDGTFYTGKEQPRVLGCAMDELQTIYKNGKFTNTTTLAQVRRNTRLW